MNRADVTALMASVSVVVREFVDNAIAAVSKRLDALVETATALDQRYAALPVPKDGSPGSSAFQIACLGGFRGSEGEWLESLRGKDAESVNVAAIIADVVAQIPKPKNGDPGENAEIDYDRLGGMVTATVGAAIAALPKPEKGDAGKDADRDLVLPLVMIEVEKAVAALPKPENGKDADPELVRAEVAKAVAQIPKPDAGKDADPAEIARAVADAVAAIPKQKDVEPVDYTEIAAGVKHMVAEAVAAIPAPQNGKSVDPEIVMAMVAAEVAKIPPAAPGKNADPIHPDSVALMVVTEVAKAVEKAVAAIRVPEDGRDAIQCEPLLSIDEAKSYPRGTYAAHRGGTIRSFRQTDPVGDAGLLAAGWAVMANGVTNEAEETIDDGRTDKRVTRYTDGTELVRTIARAVVIDRGVWVEGRTYVKGDGVTWGGSFWIAQKDTDSKPDAGNGDFRLSVKRGRDGADKK